MKLENKDITFKVAMDSEQAKANNHATVNVTVTFDNADPSKIIEMALKAQIVAWQSQIRSNWQTFLEKGIPDSIVFGEPLYESTKGKVTVSKATNVLKAQLSTMSDAEKLAYLKECGLL